MWKFNKNRVGLVVTVLIVGVLGLIAFNGVNHHGYAEKYLEACHKKNGVRVNISKGRGWGNYICIKRDSLVEMGDLESHVVVYPP